MPTIATARPTGVTATWISACVAAEAIGMTAAAAAARSATHVTDDGHTLLVWGYLIVVVGGLVEGVALGVLQGRALRVPAAHRARVTRRWLVATVLVAGLGWAAGSAPSTLSGDSGGADPSPYVVVAGAAALGVLMGALLGAAQAWALRGAVRHPWRWVAASALGWAGAMPVIFLGATFAGADWTWPWVVALGTVTGIAAGAVLGTLTAPFLGTLDGPSLPHQIVVRLLESPYRGILGEHVVGLAVVGAVTGRTHRFPVLAASAPGRELIVVPGHPDRKRWWRNLAHHSEVRVLRDGTWHDATAAVLTAQDPAWIWARGVYVQEFPRTAVGSTQPLVVVHLAPVAPAADAGLAARTA